MKKKLHRLHAGFFFFGRGFGRTKKNKKEVVDSTSEPRTGNGLKDSKLGKPFLFFSFFGWQPEVQEAQTPVARRSSCPRFVLVGNVKVAYAVGRPQGLFLDCGSVCRG